MPFNALLNLFRKQPPPSPPQEILRAPTWYENALLTATSPNIPQENALVTAMDRLTAASAVPAKNYITTGQTSPQDVIQGLTGQKRGEWTDVIASRYPNLNPFLQKAYGFGMNVLTDPTNLMPGAMMAGEIKNVYHGSPHLFDKFSHAKIGTGEGAQAFGHGLYFSTDKGVAQTYTKSVGKIYDRHGKVVELDDFISMAKDAGYTKNVARIAYNRLGNYDSADSAIADLQRMANVLSREGFSPVVQDLIDEIDLVKYLDKNGYVGKTSGGHIYEATIAKGRPHTMLQWEEPVSNDVFNKITSTAQKDGIDLGLNNPSAHFKIWIRKHYPSLESSFDAGDISDWHRKELMKQYEEETGKKAALKKDVLTASGSRLYRLLSGKLGSDEATSAFLKRAGIDGIEYPSGTLSGIKDSPHKNYVVFDDADITIEKRTPR